MVLFCAEYDADGGVFAILTFYAVEQGKVIVHLARVFGFELAYLQVNGHQTAQFPVKEEHIYTAFLSVVLHCVLVANEGETLSQFKQEQLYLFDKPLFQLKFKYRLRHPEKTEIISVAEHLVGIPRLCGRQRGCEIVVSRCRQIRLMHLQFKGVQQQVAVPAFFSALMRIVPRIFVVQIFTEK